MTDFLYVSSLPTITHPLPLYVALDRQRSGPTAWYLTDDPALAYPFARRHDADEALDELRGTATSDPRVRAYHLVDTEGRIWHATPNVPRSR